MSVSGDRMELPEAEIRRHYDQALSMLSRLDHAPRIARAQAAPTPERSPGIGGRRRFRSTTPGLATRSHGPSAQGVQILARIEALDPDALPSAAEATAQRALRRALAIALALSGQVAARSGLDALKRENLAGTLPAARRDEFAELLAVEALASLAGFAIALQALLRGHEGQPPADPPPLDEVLTENAPLALGGALWELDRRLAALGEAPGEGALIGTLEGFAEALAAAAQARAGDRPRLSAFTGASWHIAAGDITIAGFAAPRGRGGGTLSMSFKKPHEVVGNHIAKHQAMKLAKMMMAYDFERRMNPFAEIGGFIFTFMGDGAPGTGKTTLIQMMAGLLHEYCQNAGYPFRYANFSIDQIDSYQGKSGQNARAFVNGILDPGLIGFGTIDDIDQIAGKRGDRQSSAGQQEVTAVFMEAFAGAKTVVRGNCSFGMFSNFPENVDDALRQRAGARFLVDGPQSREDYIDILALLLGKRHEIPLGDHDLYAAQALKRAVAASYESHDRPQEPALARVWDRVAERLGPLDRIDRLGSYLKAIQEVEPRFTGRAIKNITDAVKVRAMDVELPDEWMEDPAAFLSRDYDSKKAMILELTRPITARMVVQEINRYADSEFRYAGSSDEAAIAQAMREMRRHAEARRRLAEGDGA